MIRFDVRWTDRGRQMAESERHLERSKHRLAVAWLSCSLALATLTCSPPPTMPEGDILTPIASSQSCSKGIHHDFQAYWDCEQVVVVGAPSTILSEVSAAVDLWNAAIWHVGLVGMPAFLAQIAGTDTLIGSPAVREFAVCPPGETEYSRFKVPPDETPDTVFGCAP